jgi:hypothetical protein
MLRDHRKKPETILSELADALGGKIDGGPHDWRGWIEVENGITLICVVRGHGAQPSKLTIQPGWDTGTAQNGVQYVADEIGMNGERDPKELAKEIRRRFDFVELARRVERKRIDAQVKAAMSEAFAEEWAGLLVRFPNIVGAVKPGQQEVSFTIRSTDGNMTRLLHGTYKSNGRLNIERGWIEGTGADMEDLAALFSGSGGAN